MYVYTSYIYATTYIRLFGQFIRMKHLVESIFGMTRKVIKYCQYNISFSNVQFACKYCRMKYCKREQKYISWRTASKKAIDFQVIVYSYII